MLQAELVFSAVFFGDVTPLPAHMLREEYVDRQSEASLLEFRRRDSRRCFRFRLTAVELADNVGANRPRCEFCGFGLLAFAVRMSTSNKRYLQPSEGRTIWLPDEKDGCV